MSCDEQETVTYSFNNGATCACDSASLGSYVDCTGTTAVIEVDCPLDAQEASDLCASLKPENSCPDDCSGNGICLGLEAGKLICHCMYGFA